MEFITLIIILSLCTFGQFIDIIEDTRRIIGGVESHVLPFFVQLRVLHPDRISTCGGSLLTPNGAVTAAHCVLGCEAVTAYFGSANKFEGLSRRVHAWLPHPDYDPNIKANDVGVIVWKEAISWTKEIKPISIGQHPSLGTKLEVAGFGVMHCKGKPSNRLRSVKIALKDNGICKKNTVGIQKFFEKSPPDSYLCTDENPYKGGYSGDSGGPLFLNGANPVLVGIAVIAPPDCSKGASLYSSANFYNKWIQDTIKCLQKKDKSKCVMT